MVVPFGARAFSRIGITISTMIVLGRLMRAAFPAAEAPMNSLMKGKDVRLGAHGQIDWADERRDRGGHSRAAGTLDARVRAAGLNTTRNTNTTNYNNTNTNTNTTDYY